MNNKGSLISPSQEFVSMGSVFYRTPQKLENRPFPIFSTKNVKDTLKIFRYWLFNSKQILMPEFVFHRWDIELTRTWRRFGQTWHYWANFSWTRAWVGQNSNKQWLKVTKTGTANSGYENPNSLYTHTLPPTACALLECKKKKKKKELHWGCVW